MDSSQRDTDPFGPLEAVVAVLLGLVVASVVLFSLIGVVNAVRGESGNVSIATIGDRSACALVSNEAVPGSTDIPQRGIRREIASVHAEEVEVCLDDPTWFQKAASALQPVGDLILGVGALLLIRRVIRTGRRTGSFTDVFARRVRQLGWFLLGMSLIWPFAAAAGRGLVVDAAVRGRSWTFVLSEPDISIGLVIAAVGVLTVARVLRRAVVLQQEVDETV